jgi:DNA-binding NtrC family response regulator
MPAKKRIVIIEDFEPTRSSICKALEEKGFEIIPFKNLAEAMVYIEASPPDLILSDLITHKDLEGVEHVIDRLLEKKLRFAFWMTPTDPGIETQKNQEEISLFMEGLPEHYRISYNPEKALDQEQIDLIVENFKNKKKTTLSFFNRSTALSKILDYFNI